MIVLVFSVCLVVGLLKFTESCLYMYFVVASSVTQFMVILFSGILLFELKVTQTHLHTVVKYSRLL